jgi:hypothetical protein
MLEKFGGDSLGEMKRNVDGYLAQLDARRLTIADARAAARDA